MELRLGGLVRVHELGLGMLECDNEDGSWSVRLRDGSERNVPVSQIAAAGPVEGGARLVADPAQESKPEGWTRFVCFSDTHGLHGDIPKAHIVQADVLLHAGDFTNTGELDQVQSFVQWLHDYPAAKKVVIAGNHDLTFQPDFYQRAWSRFHPEPYDCNEVRAALIGSGCCSYLEDATVEVEGYRIYGSPWQPEFCDWAFNLKLGGACRAAWQKIPAEVDIIITHGPPLDRGDLCSHGARVGCPDLLKAVEERAVPVSLAGHIHEGYGALADGVTLFVNASTCTLSYRPTHPPIVFDLPPPAQLRTATRAAAAAAGVQVAGAAARPESEASEP
mmetsp:Transcript_14075/g.43576  ORF Transcript_14075/g.43576 Transcript_14075/m.43576 type:complete len:333 (-) Transcript_14075:19-1017(-)